MGPRNLKAVVWNVYHGTPAATLAPAMVEQIKRGVRLFLMAEAGGHDLSELCRSLGLLSVAHGGQRIAWVPADALNADLVHRPGFPGLQLLWSEPLRLSDTGWHHVGDSPGSPLSYSDAVGALFSDCYGRTLHAVSYHLPPHVQHPAAPPARVKAAEESWARLSQLSISTRATGVLFGGDDNYDETRPGGPGPFRYGRGLTQIRAPRPTHAGGRRIDDFVTRSSGPGKMRRIGAGWVVNVAAPDDHNLFGQQFAWPA